MMSGFEEKKWRSAKRSPIIYWIIGSVLLWLKLPAYFADVLAKPNWFAPNYLCDSLGVLIFQLRALLMPFLGISFLVVGIVTFLSTWKRSGENDIFNFRLGRSLWNWIVTILFLCMAFPFASEIVIYLYEISFLSERSSDCGGTAEEVVLIMRRPILQLSPIINSLILVWLLYMRAYATSSKKEMKPKSVESAQS